MDRYRQSTLLSIHRKETKRFAEDAARVVATYKAAKTAAANPPKEIGKRKIKRITIPPFERPEKILASGVYALACKAFLAGHSDLLEAYVCNRDRKSNPKIVHKPRNATVVDWAIRCVNRPDKTKEALGIRTFVTLMSATEASHLATELNFAFRHDIKVDLVTAFIHLVGGYEIISAKEADGGYELDEHRWLRSFQDYALEDMKSKLDCEAEDGTDDDNDDWDMPRAQVASRIKPVPEGKTVSTNLDPNDDW